MTKVRDMRMCWPAYFEDTRRLTTAQHGAYLLLLGEMWIAGGSLLDDDIQLAAFARSSLEDWRLGLRPALRRFFHVKRGRLWQKRLRREITKDRQTAASKNAVNSGPPSGHSRDSGSRKQMKSQAEFLRGGLRATHAGGGNKSLPLTGAGEAPGDGKPSPRPTARQAPESAKALKRRVVATVAGLAQARPPVEPADVYRARKAAERVAAGLPASELENWKGRP